MGWWVAGFALFTYPTIERFCADRGYRGAFIYDLTTLKRGVDISEKIKPEGWHVELKRWVVERTFAWLKAVSRRLCKKKKLAVEFIEERSEVVVQEQLIANNRPVGDRAVCPLFLLLYNSQIKQFENRIVIGKCAAFSHFAKTGIDSLNRVCRVHNLTNRRRVIEKLLDYRKAPLPDR